MSLAIRLVSLHIWLHGLREVLPRAGQEQLQVVLPHAAVLVHLAHVEVQLRLRGQLQRHAGADVASCTLPAGAAVLCTGEDIGRLRCVGDAAKVQKALDDRVRVALELVGHDDGHEAMLANGARALEVHLQPL